LARHPHLRLYIVRVRFYLEIMLTEQLTTKEKKELLQQLFGFDLINDDESENGEHWVVYDEEGEEFYGSNENCQFDFSTLVGFFSYTAHRAKNQGYSDCQCAMRKVLGV
jgi:hypothetical protein